MSFEPKYSIDSIELQRKLEAIATVNGNLQVLRMNPEWAGLLESKSKLKEAVASIGIEGTVVTLEQAKAITGGDGGVVIGEKERREFEGYFDTLAFIKDRTDDSLNLKMLLTIHEMITRGSEEAMPGSVRDNQNYVKRNGKVVFTPPPASQLSFLIKEFISWFNKTVEDDMVSPIIAGAICHFWFVWIHPFRDGNGRVARILTTLMLLKKNSEGIRYFALSDYYNRNTDEYYDTLEKTNISDATKPAMNFKADLSPWVMFFVNSYDAQMDDLKRVTNAILQYRIRVEHLRKEGLITTTHEKVLSFLSEREKTSHKELATFLDVSNARVSQVLKPLRKASILIEKKIGGAIWFSLGSPENEPDESLLVAKKSRKGRTKKIKIAVQSVLPIFKD